MTEFVVVKEIIKVKISDKESYDVMVPSVGESKKFSKELKEVEAKDAVDAVQNILVKLGLPLKVQEEHFTVDSLLDLWRVVNGDKKK